MQDDHEIQELNAENSRLSAELNCSHSDLVHMSHSADKCRHLEFLVECIEREKITLQEMNQKLNDKISELHR